MYALHFDKTATVAKAVNISYVYVQKAVGFVTDFCMSIQRNKKTAPSMLKIWLAALPFLTSKVFEILPN